MLSYEYQTMFYLIFTRGSLSVIIAKPRQEALMIARFQGEEGKRRLVSALQEHVIINGDEEVSKAIAEKAELRQFAPGDDIIKQDGYDSDIFFVISGAVNILVNGRVIANRTSGYHIGEMALIDPTAKRSATVKASELTVVAALSEPDFTVLADKNPELWRRIAVELASRLRERSKFHRQPNSKPMIFIGSSKEALGIAEKIQNEVVSDDLVVKTWTDGVFDASATAIESLASVVEMYDFGVIVLSADDMVESRGVQKHAPRDNAVFELGLLMGGFGRARTFIVKPKGLEIKIPSDLLSITCLEFDPASADTTASSISSMCDVLRGKFSSMGPR